MARIVERMDDNELLGENTKALNKASVENIPQEENKMDTLLSTLNTRVSILNGMSKNNTKLYNKGVIVLELTCSKCGRKFNVQMTHANYHKLLLLHLSMYSKENRLANNIEIANLMTNLKLRVPLIETFYSQLCQRCISIMKCQRLGNNVENVEKSSL